MNPLSEPQTGKRPGLLHITLVLLAVLVLYPIAGIALTMLVTGGRFIDPDFTLLDPDTLSRIRVAQVIGQVLVLALPVFWLAKRFSGSRSAFGETNLAWLGLAAEVRIRPILTAAAAMLLLQPLMFTIAELQSLLLPLLGETGRDLLKQQEMLELFIRKLASSSSLPESLSVFGMLVATPAICEELFFRGYVQKGISNILSPARGVLLTGFVFALFHMEPTNILPLSLLGWFIGYIYRKTGNLAVPAVAHATNNFLALLLLEVDFRFAGYSISNGDTGIVFMWQWWGIVLVSMVIFFLLMRRFPETSASAYPDNV